MLRRCYDARSRDARSNSSGRPLLGTYGVFPSASTATEIHGGRATTITTTHGRPRQAPFSDENWTVIRFSVNIHELLPAEKWRVAYACGLVGDGVVHEQRVNEDNRNPTARPYLLSPVVLISSFVDPNCSHGTMEILNSEASLSELGCSDGALFPRPVIV